MHALSHDGTVPPDNTEDASGPVDVQESSLKNTDVGLQEIVIRRAPINRCPAEVLSMIFKLAIHDTPTHVRRLLLVCSLWCRLAIGDPFLWCTIKLTLHYDSWKVRWWVRRHRLFVERCLERSKAVPLDINLSLESLRSIDEQLDWKQTIIADNACHRFSHPELVRTYPHYWLDYDYWSDEGEYDWDDDRSWDSDEWHARKRWARERDPERHSKPEHVFGLLEAMTGPEGIFMQRWRSLDLVFPAGEDMAYGVWNLISYPLPNLSHLFLSNIFVPFYEDQENFESIQLVESPRFTVDELNNWEFLELLPSTLYELSIPAKLEPKFLRQLSRFKALCNLTLLTGLDDYEELVAQERTRIVLPSLEKLVINASITNLHGVEFNAPSLKQLVLGVTCDYFEWLLLPKVQPVPPIIYWTPELLPKVDEMVPAAQVLRSILLRFSGAHYLFVPACMKGTCLNLLRGMLSDGLLPHSWKTLAFCDTDGLEETVDIANQLAKE